MVCRDQVLFADFTKKGVNGAYTPTHRVQLEWQEFHGTRNIRSRSGPVLVILFDGL